MMDEKTMYALMNSDMQLWERAETEVKGNDITKTLVLPLGIGEIKVQFQGVDNAIKRRSAAEQWGGIVRERIKDRIDDEAVTARAQQAAAIRDAEAEAEEMVGADSGGSTGGERAASQPSVQAQTAAGPVQTHGEYGEEDGPQGTDFAARAEWLSRRIERAEADLTKWRKEMRAVSAALEILQGGDDD